MRLAACLAIAAVMSGCATYSERQAQEPWLSFVSDKPLAEFEACAAPKMRELLPGITAAPDGASTVYTHVIGSPGGVFATVTLTPSGDGTAAELRSPTRGGYYAKMGRALQDCR